MSMFEQGKPNEKEHFWLFGDEPWLHDRITCGSTLFHWKRDENFLISMYREKKKCLYCLLERGFA